VRHPINIVQRGRVLSASSRKRHDERGTPLVGIVANVH